MDTSFYALIVALLAIIYSIISRKIQYKFGNQKEMEALNIESRKLNEEYQKATKRNDKQATEAIMKKQMEAMGKMWGGVAGQFKTMVPIIAIFLALTWIVGYFDPTLQDDIMLDLVDNGAGCDAAAGDSVYTACYRLNGNHNSVWVADVKAYNGNDVVGENATAFTVGGDDIKSAHVKAPSGNAPPFVYTNKAEYKGADEIKIMAQLKQGNRATATLNSGTWFYVDLPFTIPIINVQRINEPYWWFIFISILGSFTISFAVGKIPQLKEALS